jgi:protein required for attachment to host cells
MPLLHVAHGDWVLIGDGKKALFLTNEGDPDLLNLRTLSVRIQASAAGHEQGTDRPGRAFASMSHARSSYEQTDWHELDEMRFAHEIAAQINRAVQEGLFKKLILIAPPKTLGELRDKLSPEARNHIRAEINKDLTKHAIPEIERLLRMYEV